MQNSAGGKSATAMKWAIAGFAINFALLSAPAAALAVSALEPARTVVVDAGHGGMDGGVTGVNTGVKESDLNLVMAKLLGEYLKSGGFDVVYTRRTSGGLYKEGDVNKKSADMHRRAEIISRADPVAVVSIHMNTFFQKSRRGAQVFFDPSSAKGESLALAVQEELNRTFNLPDAGRGFSPLGADKFILQQSSAPSVIVECGFLSNPSDEAHLLDADYRARFAHSLFVAIAAYLSSEA